MFDMIHEECGLFGVYSNTSANVAADAYLALFALQHRGQESCGIAVNDGGMIRYRKDLGLVPEVFNSEALEKLGKGNIAVGHVRASDSEKPERANAQPLVMRYVKGTLAIGHNGSLVNVSKIKNELEQGGAIFQTSCDAELIAYLIARERLTAGSVEQAVVRAMKKLEGAYSIVLMSPRKLLAARDPMGFRPLCIGELNGQTIFASESCALDTLGAKFVRDVRPGEVVVVDENGLRSFTDHCRPKSAMCIFEHVYFARPDSVIHGTSVHIARQRAGRSLAKEHPVEADLVMGVPDSGLDAALGYAMESGIPYGIGFIKNRYIGRTFIQDSQKLRERSVHIKLNPVSAAVKGKRVVLVDDSIVRGTTSAHIVELLRGAGAKEVHMRISSPPFLNPCYFGTDIDSRKHLIACRMSNEEIRRQIGADSLGYLSLAGLREMVHDSDCGFCDACFTGDYPVDVPQEKKTDKVDQKISQQRG